MASPRNHVTTEQCTAWLEDAYILLNTENKRLQSRTDHYRKAADSLTKDNTRLRAKCKEIHTKTHALTAETGNLRNKNEKLSTQNKRLTEQLKRRDQENAALEMENRRLADSNAAYVDQYRYLMEQPNRNLPAAYGRPVGSPRERGRGPRHY
ncbi:MAG: hypothetical protein Q9182_004771 [Xanthomendoza sp. 2 TL-2023]